MKNMQMPFTIVLVLVGLSVLAYKYFGTSKDPDFGTIILQKDSKADSETLKSLQGKATVIAFFQTWCGDCIQEIPSLIALKKSIDSPDLKILMVTDEKEEKVTYFKNKFSQFELDYYYTSVPLKELGIKRYPTTYLIDANGKIWLKTLEGYDWNSAESKELIKKLIEK